MTREQLRRLLWKEAASLMTDDAVFRDHEPEGLYPERDIPGDYDGRMLDCEKSMSYDGDGKSVKANLYHTMKDALSLYDSLHDGDDLPEWVENNITTARDRIQIAADYMDFRINKFTIGK